MHSLVPRSNNLALLSTGGAGLQRERVHFCGHTYDVRRCERGPVATRYDDRRCSRPTVGPRSLWS